MLYLDNAATSLKKPFSVYAFMIKNTIFNSVNAGRGGHKLSVRGMAGIVDTQDLAAELFNINNPQNIAFTQNATYALNMVILGVLCRGGHVIVTEMEHNSVLRPVYRLGDYTVVKADKYGRVKPAAIKKAIRENTKLIVCTHASNVCGTIQPIEEIGKIAKANNILFMVDAAQTAGCLTVDAEKSGADFIVFSGHKGLMGPLGTGGVFVKNPDSLEAVITGGTGSGSESITQPRIMPDMLHSGTINTPAIIALGKGIKYVLERGTDEIAGHEKRLAREFEARLRNMDNVKIYGSNNKIATVAFNIGVNDSAYTEQLLGDDIAVRAGYHCAPLAHKALGTQNTGAVRVSFGAFNRMSDVYKIADRVYKASKMG